MNFSLAHGRPAFIIVPASQSVECPELAEGLKMKWYVYILKCSNGSYYTGHTNSVENRFYRHKTKAGAKYTATFRPQSILYKEDFKSKKEAVQREQQIKGWSRAKKQALIDGNVDALKTLSKSRD